MDVPADTNAAHWPDPDDEARIEEALAGTFPASDAPPWTLGVAPKESDMKVSPLFRSYTFPAPIDPGACVGGVSQRTAARDRAAGAPTTTVEIQAA